MIISIYFVLAGAGFLCVGAVLGYLARQSIAKRQIDTAEARIGKLLSDAHVKEQDILLKAKNDAQKLLEEAKREEREGRQELKRLEDRLLRREDQLDRKSGELEQADEALKARIVKVKQVKDELEALKEKEFKELERVSGMSQEQARSELVAKAEKEAADNISERLRRLEREGSEAIERKAKDIMATVIQRYASSHVADATTTVVNLPSDDLKGRIIGKEGRNIKALERLTGVDIIIDDTPEAVILSSFDPVRRAIAKAAIEKLIADGRIQPARIEDTVEWAKTAINQKMREAAEQAVYDAGITGLDPRLLPIIGRLHYRTSYGQNVLAHSVEMAHIAGMLASELSADVQVSKKGALLHDIGKAVDHEVPGTHVEIGRKILQKFGVEETVVKAMQAHHEEYPYETIESIIVQIADALSGARPGARRDTVEIYLKRLEELEKIATSFEGVEKAYAIQAGREVRVFVTPDRISDAEAHILAKNIAHRIQEDLKYPGEIKVNVIRELRAIEYAR
ncbi:MAG: ribonuclease Y [bacterium]|nr:ribonuclease Y [bacterium]